jgi:hypothetical protein
VTATDDQRIVVVGASLAGLRAAETLTMKVSPERSPS